MSNDVIYGITKNCPACGHVWHFPLSKRAVTFEEFDPKNYLELPCPQCKNVVTTYSVEWPELDKEILDTWGLDESLYFSEQDEDLVLADMRHLDLLLQAIDERQYLKGKMYTMVYALLVLIYDLERTGQKAAYEKVRSEALKRKEILLEYKFGKDYVTKVVYPLLGL